MASNQGFASKSKDERGKLAKKGGKAAHAKGTAHTWNGTEAKSASQKGVIARQRNAALRAAQRLLLAGFTVGDLNFLKLTADELRYYGGPRATEVRFDELRRRLKKAQEDANAAIPPATVD